MLMVRGFAGVLIALTLWPFTAPFPACDLSGRVRDAFIRRQPGIIVRQCAGGRFLFARTACFTSVSAPALRCPRCVQMLRGSPASVIRRVDTI